MKDIWVYLISILSFFLVLLLRMFFISHSKSMNKKLPPSPPSLPIIGHLHLMKEPLHQTLQQLAEQYGPVLSLSFGSRSVLVVSSLSAAEECFTQNDLIFADRPRLLAGKYLGYDYTAIGSASYGPHWRNSRRIIALEVSSTARLNNFLGIRQEEVAYLVKNLFHDSGQRFTKVEMKSRISDLTFNIIMRMVAGKRYFGVGVEDKEEARKFRDIIRDLFEQSGSSNPVDFLPFLRWFDFKGYEKTLIRLGRTTDDFLQGLIEEHKKNRKKSASLLQGERDRTMVDSMLHSQELEPESYSDEIIKGLIMSLVIAGTDTSAATIEWAMSLLLNHPTTLKKAQAELDNYVGHARLVDESDLPNLPYLQSIVNESLRLFPAAPLLVPHESSDDSTVGGFHVACGTILLINAWGIHRDPQLWNDPTSFRPERFEDKGDGGGCKLIPFGLGRRSCPGAGLANRVVGFALAALIQSFDWERVGESEVDMRAASGLTMPKAKPLEAMCKVRTEMVDILLAL